MYGILQKFYVVCDWLTGTTDEADATQKARSRALVVWVTVSGPLVLVLNLAAHGFDLSEPAVVTLLAAVIGTVSAVPYLRLTGQLETASIIFLISSVCGMSAAALVASGYNILPLASLTATPVLFGLILSWHQCLRFTFVLTGFFVVTAIFFGAFHISPALLVYNTLALGLATFGVGLSTAGYAYANERAALKLKQQKEQIETLAYRDPLTGLKNLRALDEALVSSLGKSDAFTLAFMDLNHFKTINDQFGHSAGDALLVAIANRLTNSPHVSYAARIGGDEFAFVLDSKMIGNSVTAAIKEIHSNVTESVVVDQAELRPGASIGFVESSSVLDSVAQLIPAAESAMRRAKQSRTGWTQYDAVIDNASVETAALELAFRSALESGNVRAVLQPILCARNHEIKGYELLSRWTGSDLPVAPRPDQFIPIAEKLGLLNELLWTTLKEALTAPQLDEKYLSINVSPAQIVATDFIPKMLKCLRESNFNPQQLTLEVTEDVAFRNLDKNIKVLRLARRHGISVALDDFGRGYSSLSIVEKLPLDKVKIDRSFAFECDRNDRKRSLLEIAIQMAEKLGLESCVEGIETHTVANCVAELGATEVQGFLFGKPELIAKPICSTQNNLKSDLVRSPTMLRA
ncbi:MAG: bifunctional diguanylate cyclase/phosphodiesterase [Pseudomonadota bacterium]